MQINSVFIGGAALFVASCPQTSLTDLAFSASSVQQDAEQLACSIHEGENSDNEN